MRRKHDPASDLELAFVRHLWGEFVSQRVVRCLREDKGTLAVTVTEEIPTRYQLVCSACAWHSAWFGSEAGRLYPMHGRETVRMI